MSKIYGIDLGTTNSVLGLGDQLLTGLVPSVVDLRTGNAGNDVLEEMSAARSFKCDISLSKEGQLSVSASSRVLRQLVKESGESVERVVISVPAYFSDNQRQATIKAAQLAGLDVVGLINEPTAAAIYASKSRQALSLVFDLGGGTFDVSVVDSRFGDYDVQANLMCMNYDLPLTEKAKLQIESGYMPVFCVAAYNGYYMYTPTKDSEGGWYLQGTQKIPYAYVVGDKYYALNLGGDNVHLLKDGQLTKATLASQGLEVKEVYRQINSIVSDALMYQFQLSTGRGGEFVYIPSALTTFKRVNPIEGPTVLAFIDGWDFKTTHAISAFSIGGAQIEASRMVAGYEAINPDGSVTKMYAYADLLPENKHVIDMFTSVEEAAKAGYYYDPIFMG